MNETPRHPDPPDMEPVEVESLSDDEVPGILVKIASILATLAAKLAVRRDAPDRLLDVDEASKMLGCSKSWLYHAHKKLPFAKKLSSGQLRFSKKGIEEYLRSNSVR